MLEAFVWGSGGRKLSPAEAAREKEIAEALLAGAIDTSPVGHWLQGAARMGQALSGKIREGRANKASDEGRSAYTAKFNEVLGGASDPVASVASSLVAPSSPSPAPDYASARVTQAHGNSGFNNDLRSGIIATAEAIGADPIDLATAISYETAGTFDPLKRGPTTQWGRHRGLIQFGEPQARQHGVDWNDPLGSQLGPDGAIASYFRSSGFKPGMSGLDLYSTINAGAPGRYKASDANNGGAPGTVRDKWEKQMAGHRRKAEQLIGDYRSGRAPTTESGLTPEALQQWAFANVPQQLGAVDAVNALGNAQPVGVANNEADILAQEAAMAQADPQAFQGLTPSGGVSMPQMPNRASGLDMQTGQPAMVDPVHSVAASLTNSPVNPDLPMAGNASGFLPVQQAQAQSGPSMQQLIELASDPWANDAQRGIAQALLSQQMQQQEQARDPMRLLQLQKAQLELEAMRNPQPQMTDTQRNLQYRAQEAGLVPGSPEYINFMLTGGTQPAQTNINLGNNSSKFVEESDKAAATRMNDYVTAGAQAAQTMSDMQQLLDLGAIIGTGREAEFKASIGPYAQMAGIDVANLGEAQAFKAITDRLAPQMRPVGAGSSSDRDVSMFLSSLPNLRNDPQGNIIIANTMRGIAQNKMQAAEIAARAQTGEIQWQDAEKQIRALPNPYDNFKEFMKESNGKDKPLSKMTDEELEAIVNGQR